MNSDASIMRAPPNAQLSHIGMFVRDLDTMVEFYRRIMGMSVSDSGHFMGRDLAFLSRTPEEHHQIVMIMDPAHKAGGLSALCQISFRVDHLEDLRAYHAFLDEHKVEGLEARNHGNSWSIYFFDPEGNKIELYVPTPWHFQQPWRAPLDLAESADAIIAQSEELVRKTPATMSMDAWKRQFVERMLSQQEPARSDA